MWYFWAGLIIGMAAMCALAYGAGKLGLLTSLEAWIKE